MKKFVLALFVATTFGSCIKVAIDDSVNNTGGGGPSGCTGTKEQIITCNKIILV